MSEDPEIPLLATKMHVPRQRTRLVARPDLTARIEAAPQARLILVTAPPGFGKTTALTEWLSTTDSRPSIAWVSVDERDNVPRTFWRYVLTALTRTTSSARPALTSFDRPETPLEVVLAQLVNELDLSTDDVVLVLDDFHTITDGTIIASMEFLIENAPANLRIALAGRADPALSIARLRASGDVVELRAADLRFGDEEIADYFRLTGAPLEPTDAAALAQRTEGWIAAIQLAAISLQNHPEPDRFIASFAGDDRYIVDYLMEEVLHGQPEHVRRFLLQTSILSRFTGSLTAFVTDVDDGAGMLTDLERSNLFLIPLDDRRGWFRYHHLFAQMLRARLVAEQPDRMPQLHDRASRWFAEQGLVEEAVAHAIDAGSFERAASLILAEAPALRRRRDEATLVRWLALLPRATVEEIPRLSLEFAGALLSVGRGDEVDRLLNSAAAGAHQDEVRSLQGGVALYRAARALASGDLADAAAHARDARDRAGAEDHLARGSANGITALVHWSLGELSDAESSWSVAVEQLRLAGHLSDSLGGAIALTDLAVAQGRLSSASEIAREGLRIATSSTPTMKGAADMMVALADVLREQDDLPAARQILADASALGGDKGLPQNAHRLLAATARVHLAEGDPVAAIAAFDAAEHVFTPDFFPDHHPIAAQRACAYLAAGRIPDARDWARRRRFDTDGELTYLNEYEHLAFARVLLADGNSADRVARARRLMERMLGEAEKGGRRGSAIEIRVLLARAYDAAGDRDSASAALDIAVRDAESEGYVRVFADEGAPIRELLTRLNRRRSDDAYLRRLINAASARTASAPTASSSPLLSPLSVRELEVLRLLRSDLGGVDIARHLSVSLNTMRTHTKNIYSKLGVTSRRAAVTRATELGLVSG
jgi:LuxR family maltose regulon positive regulatory protein